MRRRKIQEKNDMRTRLDLGMKQLNSLAEE